MDWIIRDNKSGKVREFHVHNTLVDMLNDFQPSYDSVWKQNLLFLLAWWLSSTEESIILEYPLTMSFVPFFFFYCFFSLYLSVPTLSIVLSFQSNKRSSKWFLFFNPSPQLHGIYISHSLTWSFGGSIHTYGKHLARHVSAIVSDTTYLRTFYLKNLCSFRRSMLAEVLTSQIVRNSRLDKVYSV